MSNCGIGQIEMGGEGEMKRDYSEEQPKCHRIDSVCPLWCRSLVPMNRAFIIVRKWCLSVVSVIHEKKMYQFISRENMIPAFICGVGIVLVVKFIVPVSFKKLFVLFF